MSWCLWCDCGSDEIIRILFPDLRLKSGVNVWVWLENESFLISIAVTVQLNELQDVCLNSVRLSSRQWGWTCRMFARRWISPPRVHTRLHLVRKTVTAGNRLQRQTSDYLRSQSRRLPVSVGCAGKHPDSFLMYTRRQSLGIEQDAVDDEWKYNLFFCISSVMTDGSAEQKKQSVIVDRQPLRTKMLMWTLFQTTEQNFFTLLLFRSSSALKKHHKKWFHFMIHPTRERTACTGQHPAVTQTVILSVF